MGRDDRPHRMRSRTEAGAEHADSAAAQEETVSDEPAVLTTKRGRTAVLELNRPRRRNALDLQDRRELIAALDAAGGG